MSRYEHVTDYLAQPLRAFEIKEFAHQIAQDLIDEFPSENAQKRPYAALRRAVIEAFPDAPVGSGEPGFPSAWTDSGKGGIERYQHIFLLYLAMAKAELNKGA